MSGGVPGCRTVPEKSADRARRFHPQPGEHEALRLCWRSRKVWSHRRPDSSGRYCAGKGRNDAWPLRSLKGCLDNRENPAALQGAGSNGTALIVLQQSRVEDIPDRRRRGRRVFLAKRKRERVSARPSERHPEIAVNCHAERSLRAVSPPEGAGGQAVNTCCLCPYGTRAAFAATHVAASLQERNRTSRATPPARFHDRAFLTKNLPEREKKTIFNSSIFVF